MELCLKNTSVAISSGGEAARQNENTLGVLTHILSHSHVQITWHTQRRKDREIVIDTAHRDAFSRVQASPCASAKQWDVAPQCHL